MAKDMAEKVRQSESTAELNVKPFRLPCLMKLEDLLHKFSGELEINWRNRNKHMIKLTGQANHNGDSSIQDYRSISGSQKQTDESPSKRTSSSRESGDHSHETQFKAPRRVGFKRTPKLRTNVVNKDPAVEPKTDVTLTKEKPTTTTTGSRRLDDDDGIGSCKDEPRRSTMGSRHGGPTRTRSGKVRQQTSKVNGQYVFGGCRIKSGDDLIDTKNFVDEAMIVFLPEMCQRLGIDLVEDPMDLCTKFNLIIADVNLHLNEIECIDMTDE